MRTTGAVVLALLMLMGAACSGSPSLTEEEEAYCLTAEPEDLGNVAAALGIDLNPVYDEGQRIFDEGAESGDFEAARERALEYLLGDSRFVDVCKQAYAGR